MSNVIKMERKLKKPLPHSKRVAQEIINKAAEDSGNISYTLHAKERMLERHFSLNDVLTILRDGIVRSEPRYNEEKRSWKYKVDFVKFDGDEDASCVVVIQKKAKLTLITVFGIDDKEEYYD